MSDYIEREAAQSAVWEEDNQTDMILAIGSLPAADVAPVRHGRWIDSSNGWMCSECKQDNTYDKPYCPNCGALMDGKEYSQRDYRRCEMTGNEYQKLAMRTAGAGDIKYLIENGVMGLNGEAGECIDLVKKWRFQGHPLDARKLMDELGDVLWYVAITASGLSYGLDEIMQHNIDKLRLRYPDGFDAERSIHREGERDGFGSTGR